MYIFKRIAALLLTLCMVLTALPALGESDAAALSCGDAVDMLLAAADDYNPDASADTLLADFPGGALDTAAPVTRAQALILLDRAFGGLPAPAGDAARMIDDDASFSDIPDWAAEALSPVLTSGILTGNEDGLLRPDKAIAAEELNQLIYRAYALLGGNPKDDFYATVNHDWLTTSTLLAGLSINGPFYGLSLTVNEQVAALIQDIAAGEPEPGTPEAKIKALYDCVTDREGRNETGIAPLQLYLDAIDSASTLDELLAADAQMLHELGLATLLGFGVTADLTDSTKHIVSFSAVSPTLDKNFYLNGTDAQNTAYLNYIATLFTLSGMEEAAARSGAETVHAAEQAIAQQMLEPQDYGNVDKIHNLFTLDELQAIFPNADLQAVYAAYGLQPADKIMVTDVGAMRAAAALFNDEHLDTLKVIARWALLYSMGACLNSEFLDAAYDFTLAYYGVDARQDDDAIAAQQVQSLLADYLGRAYAEAYFSPEAKADVEEMIREFIDIYHKRIQAQDWMSVETRARAARKLDCMRIKVGYPDKWNSYLDNAEIKSPAEGGSFFSNVAQISRAALAHNISQQLEEVDKSEWAMYAFTVNACYDSSANDITFPAAILQAPLYDVNASREENLGGIGYIIAHEITHAFDNNGAKFDENGNAADWWTAQDYAAFSEKCQAVAEWYDGQEVYPGIVCSGELTVSENVADLGSVRCVVAAAQRLDAPDYDVLFRAIANTWASTTSRQMRQYLATMDVHAPDKLRCNRVLQTLPEFYDTYDIQIGDGMWTEPDSRVSVW